MTLLLENETGQDPAEIRMEETARAAAGAALEAAGCPFETQVNLTITDNEGIRQLNRDFRGIDSPTDVLSFPLCGLPGPGDFSLLEAYADEAEREAEEPEEAEEEEQAETGEPEEAEEEEQAEAEAAERQGTKPDGAGGAQDDPADCFDPETGELLLGDIVVNLDRVRSQAREYGHSLRREFAFLIVHSMLHLMGYDHVTPAGAEQMESMQERILTGLGIRR